MSDELEAKLKRARSDLWKCRRDYKQEREARARLDEFLKIEGFRVGWSPDKHVLRQYGWVYAWSFPLHQYLDRLLYQRRSFTPEVRNRIMEIFTAIIAQLVAAGKYGICLPFDPRPVDIGAFVKRQERIRLKVYTPCVICEEDRITHDCHILPRSEGGPEHDDNYVALCPLHHHLFDHNRLLPKEWHDLMAAIAQKMEAARVYAEKIKLPLMQTFWSENSIAKQGNDVGLCVPS